MEGSRRQRNCQNNAIEHHCGYMSEWKPCYRRFGVGWHVYDDCDVAVEDFRNLEVFVSHVIV